jgi:two-component system, OmpR family, response regulator
MIQDLRDGGHVVDVTSDGDEAISLARSGEYGLILLAVVLPKRNGVAVASELRLAGESTPILLLTAGDHDAELFVREAGADGYLAKPFRFDVLQERIVELGRPA